MPAGGAAVARSRSRPAAGRSGGFVQGAGASVAVRVVCEVSALAVAGAEDVAARERVQDVDDDVQLQADEGAVVVVNAMRRERKWNRKSSESSQWRCCRCFNSIFRRLKLKFFFSNLARKFCRSNKKKRMKNLNAGEYRRRLNSRGVDDRNGDGRRDGRRILTAES